MFSSRVPNYEISRTRRFMASFLKIAAAVNMLMLLQTNVKLVHFPHVVDFGHIHT